MILLNRQTACGNDVSETKWSDVKMESEAIILDIVKPLARVPEIKDAKIKEETYKISKIEYGGRVDLLKKFEDLLKDKTMKISQIKALFAQVGNELKSRGYYLTDVQPNFNKIAQEVLVLNLNLCRFGDLNFYRASQGENDDVTIVPGNFKYGQKSRSQYDDWYFSERKFKSKMNFQPYEIFDYRRLHEKVTAINNYAYLSLITSLQRRTEKTEFKTGIFEGQVIDIDFLVNSDTPIHSSFQIDNTGTDETNEWRGQIDVQINSIVDLFDSLNFNLTTALDGSVVAGTGSYTTIWGNYQKHLVTIYGGASDLGVDDIVTSLDNDGDGWFVGAKYQYNNVPVPYFLNGIFPDAESNVALGMTHQNSRNQLLSQGTTLTNREITLTPFSFALNFSHAKEDKCFGRNALSYSLHMHFDGFLGADSDAEFDNFRRGASADYFYSQLHLSRIQQLPRSIFKGGILYIRADTQFTNDNLVSVEQKAIGGFNTVRGYREREFFGDKGTNLSIEFRTSQPVYERFRNEENWFKRIYDRGLSNKQYLLFADYGHVETNKPLPGEDRTTDIAGVGFGVRVRLGDYSHLRFDYGFALNNDIEGADIDSGRAHVVFKVGF